MDKSFDSNRLRSYSDIHDVFTDVFDDEEPDRIRTKSLDDTFQLVNGQITSSKNVAPPVTSTSTRNGNSLSSNDDSASVKSSDCSSVLESMQPLSRHARSESTSSIVDGLLFEIYDRFHFRPSRRHADSDTFTESTSEAVFSRTESLDNGINRRYSRAALENLDIEDVREIIGELRYISAQTSARLVRELKRRDRSLAKVRRSCDIITAVLQAASQKRRVDTRIRFSIEPLPGDDTFQQWRDAMRAVARLPCGIPSEFRKNMWLALADRHIMSLKIDWEKTTKFTFNERSNPDDNKLGMQIVKDLHRTGCSGFSGDDNEEDRAVLKRVLLAYARWNKQVGYCQGFNVLAALILEVMDRKEEDALKVMIFIIDFVLPDSYFANNLSALSVDMAVFRDLLQLELPKLSRHLDKLQAAARDHNTGANYEPPLTNVFTMQWFLTVFATCLPKNTALRVWDTVLLEGSEVLLRVALAIWGKLQKRIMNVPSADEFYSTMGVLTQEMLDADLVPDDHLIKTVYAMGPFPIPKLSELREKYTYNITPFSAAMATGQRPTPKGGMNIFSDDDELDEDELVDNISCFTGIMTPLQPAAGKTKAIGDADRSLSASAHDISKASPGAYAATPEKASVNSPVYMERMTMDIDMLQNQYKKLRSRQKQAHIILSAASAKHKAKSSSTKVESSTAVNHLFLNRNIPQGKKTKLATKAPSITPLEGVPLELKSDLVKGHRSSGSQNSRNAANIPESAKTENQSFTTALHKTELTIEKPIDSRERHCSGHSTDSYQSEASNNTRGSTNTDTLSSNSDSTIGVDRVNNEAISEDISERNVVPETGSADLNDNLTKNPSTDEIPCDQTDHKSKISSYLLSDANDIKEKEEVLSEKEKIFMEMISKGQTPTFLQLAELGDSALVLTERGRRTSPAKLPIEINITGVTRSIGKGSGQELVPSEEASPATSPETSPQHNGHETKSFNPFPSKHFNRKRQENGVRLGLYSNNNQPKLSIHSLSNIPVKRDTMTIGRSQRNACLHRHYMEEVKRERQTIRK